MTRFVVPVVVLLALVIGYVIGQQYPWTPALYQWVVVIANRVLMVVFLLLSCLLVRHASRLSKRKVDLRPLR